MNRLVLLLLFAFAAVDLPAQWVAVEGAGTHFNSFVDTGTRLLATSDVGGLYQSHDAGRTWTEIHTGLWEMSFPTEAIVVRGDLMFLAALGGGVARSTDNGATWSVANTGFPTQAFVTSLVLLGDTLYAGMDPSLFPGQIYRTSIDTIDWKRSDIGMPGRKAIVTALVATDMGTLFASFPSETFSYAENVYVSFDSARSWQSIPVEEATSVYDLIVDEGKVYAVAGRGLFRLSDGAVTWRKLGEIASSELLVASVAGRVMYAGTMDAGIFASSDAGESWQPINDGLPFVDDSPLAVWTDGTTALASLNLNSRTWHRNVAVSRGPEVPAIHALDLSLAPNPAHGSILLGYTLPRGSEVSIRLHSLLGNEVLAIDRGWNESGDHTITIDTRQLAPGVYIVELQAGASRQMRRLVVQR